MQAHLVNVVYPHSAKSGKSGNGRYVGIVDKTEPNLLIVLVGDDMLPLLDDRGRLKYRSFKADKVVEMTDLGKVGKEGQLIIDRLR